MDEFKNPDYREQFGYKGKFRIVPLNLGNMTVKKYLIMRRLN